VKFLIHSNGPTVSTGYGVQTANLTQRLKMAGHDVAVSCTYGQQGSMGAWRTPQGELVKLYPAGYEVNGNDVIHAHAGHFFEGDPANGWIIPLLDVWCLINPRLSDFNVAAWAPVDHFPVPKDVLKFFHNTGATPIAMSRFGERLFVEAGLDPVYIPLAVDTTKYKPTPQVEVDGKTVDARTLFGLPHDAFVVGMVGMNKGWARDRKGFNEALRAFGVFWRQHQNAVLFMHSEKWGGAEGIDLVELATHAAIPEHAIVWTDQYAYRLGLPAEMMAAAYTAMDVLLAPSHGEGFCVPLIEAQACGTPVIASDFSAQTELVGAGWLVTGQPEWDPAQHASYICPFVGDVILKLEDAYNADLNAMQTQAIEFAKGYDADLVFDTFWQPFLASLEPKVLELKPPMESVDVIVPAMRPDNIRRLEDSFNATAPLLSKLHVVWGEDSYASKVNRALKNCTNDWVLVVGDDVEFHPGWYSRGTEAVGPVRRDRHQRLPPRPCARTRMLLPAVMLTTSSSAGRISTTKAHPSTAPDSWPRRATGTGTSTRRSSNSQKPAACSPRASTSVIEHHHPGYDGREDLRQADPVYMKAVESSEKDRKTWLSRLPLIAGHKVGR
jgi:glycosyltransferase involved in cell wall biosynthesis